MTISLEQIKQAEDTLTQLRKQYEEQKQGGNPHVFVPRNGDEYWTIRQGEDRSWMVDSAVRAAPNRGFPGFRTKEAAEARAEAYQVMDELRVQPGACAWRRGPHGMAYTVGVNAEGRVYWDHYSESASAFMFGCFESDKSATAAIRTVGEDRIRKAAFTLAGVAND